MVLASLLKLSMNIVARTKMPITPVPMLAVNFSVSVEASTQKQAMIITAKQSPSQRGSAELAGVVGGGGLERLAIFSGVADFSVTGGDRFIAVMLL
jgi:hypothetical protein